MGRGMPVPRISPCFRARAGESAQQAGQGRPALACKQLVLALPGRFWGFIDPTGQGTLMSWGPVWDHGSKHPPASSGPPGIHPGWGRS